MNTFRREDTEEAYWRRRKTAEAEAERAAGLLRRLDVAERRLDAIMSALERELPEHFTRLDFDIFRTAP